MSNQQKSGRYDNYIGIHERIAAAKDDILSVETTDPILFDGSNVFGFIRATITLKDNRKATAVASFRLDATTGAQKTHPFEDCESSAIGRCLAFLGYHVNRAIASREEVEEAMAREAEHLEQQQLAKQEQTQMEILKKGRETVIDLINEMRDLKLDPSLWPAWPYDRPNVNQLSISELRSFYKWMIQQIADHKDSQQTTATATDATESMAMDGTATDATESYDDDLDSLHSEIMNTAAQIEMKRTMMTLNVMKSMNEAMNP